jgi:hypothetical protein
MLINPPAEWKEQPNYVTLQVPHKYGTSTGKDADDRGLMGAFDRHCPFDSIRDRGERGLGPSCVPLVASAELERNRLRPFDRLRHRGRGGPSTSSGTTKKMGRSLAPLDLVKNNDIASR